MPLTDSIDNTHPDPQLTGYFIVNFISNFKIAPPCFAEISNYLTGASVNFINNTATLKLLLTDRKFPVIDFLNEVKTNGIKEMILIPTKPNGAYSDYLYRGLGGVAIESECEFNIYNIDKMLYSVTFKFTSFCAELCIVNNK